METLRTALTGLVPFEWIGVLLARLSVGLLFLLSGGRKLFKAAGRQEMRQTLEAAGVPFARQTALAVSSVEFTGGGMLILGALTPLAALLLSGVMVVALATTVVPAIKASSALGWLSSFLYLPEVLYLVLLLWLFFSGAGWLSVDQGLLAPNLR